METGEGARGGVEGQKNKRPPVLCGLYPTQPPATSTNLHARGMLLTQCAHSTKFCMTEFGSSFGVTSGRDENKSGGEGG